MERFKRWRARFRVKGRDQWITVTSPDGTKIEAMNKAKATVPSFWTLAEVKPIISTQL